MKSLHTNYSLLLPGFFTLGLLCVSSAVYFAALRFATDAKLLYIHIGVLSYITGILLLYIILQKQQYHLTGRAILLSGFIGWFAAVCLQYHPDPTIALYGRLLETVALFILAYNIMLRIIRVFAPYLYIPFYYYLLLITFGTPVFLLAPSTLNATILNTGTGVVLHTGILHIYSLFISLIMILVAVLFIPAGRRRLANLPTFSIPRNDLATAPDTARDYNFIVITKDAVAAARRQALAAGKWVHYIRSYFSGKGIITTDPVALQKILDEVFAHALEQTPDRLVSADTRGDHKNSQIHLIIKHTKTAGTRKPLSKMLIAEAADIGAKLTCTRTQHNDRYVISFPLHF